MEDLWRNKMANNKQKQIEKGRIDSIVKSCTTEETPITRLDQLRFGMALKRRINEANTDFNYGVITNFYRIEELEHLAAEQGEGWVVNNLIDPLCSQNDEVTSGCIITSENIRKMEIYQVPHNTLKCAESTLRYRLTRYKGENGKTEPFSEEELAGLLLLINKK